MKRIVKYRMGCSGSGWGIWDNETGEKVEGCGTRSKCLGTVIRVEWLD